MANARTKPPKINLKPKDPRPMADIEKENGQACYQLGVLTYQVSVYQQEVDSIQARLRELNYEAAARKELDAKNQPEQKEQVNG